mmetsp:Transcript_42005/g.97244  ORF Transcript_42005/g.97244 Transcript_42005/m.97244 type:complete len:720 (-) Transcript_42005:54-2213(-)
MPVPSLSRYQRPISMAKDARPLTRRCRLGQLLSDAESKAMLAVGACAACRTFPVWNVDVPSTVRLRDVLLGWAIAVLRACDRSIPPAAFVVGKVGGPALDLNATILTLRPQLSVKGGRLCLTVSWPLPEPTEAAGKRHERAACVPRKISLNRLRISTRYTPIDRSVMGYHQSSTMKQKIESGFYGAPGMFGVQLPRGHGELMRPCGSSGLCGKETVWSGPLETRELVVYRGDAAVGAPGAPELFRTRLVGPSSQLANWAATARRFEALASIDEGPAEALRMIPFPVFVPSRGRAWRAHLNWEAPHVFGPPLSGEVGAWPVFCIVVEPQEEAEYRHAWPHALLLVLPEGGLGPSYARWVVQRVCSRAYEWKAGIRRGGSSGVCGPLRQLPWCWICDDNLLCFFRLVGISRARKGRAAVQKQREWDGKTPLFWEAMVAVQQRPSLLKVAIAGFLRDDGTATCKKRDWTSNELSLYKVVLLNNRELRRLGAEYLPGLQMFEDIYLNSEVRRLGGHTLKCQCYCFRASQVSQGGCAEQRSHGKKRSATAPFLGGLMEAEVFSTLTGERQVAVTELLQWVRLRESQCLTKRHRQNAAAGSSAAQDETTDSERSSTSSSSCDSHSHSRSRSSPSRRSNSRVSDERSCSHGSSSRMSCNCGSHTGARSSRSSIVGGDNSSLDMGSNGSSWESSGNSSAASASALPGARGRGVPLQCAVSLMPGHSE